MRINKTISLALAALLLFAAIPVSADYASGFPPEHYGGMYLDADGSVVTVIVEKYRHLYDHYPPEVKIRFGRFSLQELKEKMKELSDFMAENREAVRDLDLGIGGYGIDEKNNCIFVEMKDTSDEIIAKFKRTISDSEMISFVQREPDIEEPLPHDDEGGNVDEATPDSPLE